MAQLGNIFNPQAQSYAQQNGIPYPNQSQQIPRPQPAAQPAFNIQSLIQNIALQNPALIGIWNTIQKKDPVKLYYDISAKHGVDTAQAEKIWNEYNAEMQKILK